LISCFSGDFAAGRVYSVFSPLVETSAFIQDLKDQGSLAVDVENGYLADLVGVENLSVGSIVVISDVPGSDETLAHLEENEKKMEASLVKSLDMILKGLELSRPGDHRFPISD
jgi:uridine phosphorylase